MKILIVNNSVEHCGVYQYGKRFAKIALKSKKINFFYIEINNSTDLIEKINEINPQVVIYNYVPATMPWLNYTLIESIKKLDIKQGCIIHNQEFYMFDFYIHQNPDYKNNNNNFSIPRPIFEYNGKELNKLDDTIHIGSFGFGGKYKLIPDICKLIINQFSNEKVQLNLHITNGFYSSNNIEEIKKECLDILSVSTNIKLNISTNFITDDEILDFLYKNDLNIFLYENYQFYNGISSTIDYALSVRKPLAICRSNMFSHIYDVDPSICIENNSLSQIIKNGFGPLQEKYDSCTHNKFINTLEKIIISI